MEMKEEFGKWDIEERRETDVRQWRERESDERNRREGLGEGNSGKNDEEE